MNKYFKYFIVVLIILLSSFYTSTNDSKTDKISQEINDKIDSIDVKVEKEIAFNFLEHPKEKTVKVSHKLDSLLNRIHKRNDFHGSVLVAQNDKLLFSEQYGYANFKKKTKIEKESVFQLASVSKQFTATAILILEEQNLLELDDSITHFFPSFPYKDVTVRNLLNHTGGLPKYFWIAEHKWNEEKAPTNDEMMDLMASTNINRFFKAGRNFDYSNTGYFVLASIVENVSKKRFGDFIEENIFRPLQMNNSFVYSFENDSIHANQLDGYRIYRGWRHLKIKGTVNDAVVGDKNVYSTSEDLFKWMIGLNSGKLISKESLALMYTKGETKYGRKVPYGFGFRIGEKSDENVIYHYGKWNGFSTSISQYKESDLLIIALEHSSYNSMNYLNNKVKNIVSNYFDPELSEVAMTE